MGGSPGSFVVFDEAQLGFGVSRQGVDAFPVV
jgi:hypothetical protein